MKHLIIFLSIILIACSTSGDSDKFLREAVEKKYKEQNISSIEVIRDESGRDLSMVVFQIRMKGLDGEVIIRNSLRYSRTGDGYYQLYKPL